MKNPTIDAGGPNYGEKILLAEQAVLQREVIDADSQRRSLLLRLQEVESNYNAIVEKLTSVDNLLGLRAS